MGYTHYWRINDTINAFSFKQLQLATMKIIHHSDISLEVSFNTHPLHLSISINGIDEGAHETLYLTPETCEFAFCKTANKPYDKVVVAILNYAGHGHLEWWSDGDKVDHLDGLILYRMEFPESYTKSEEYFQPKPLEPLGE